MVFNWVDFVILIIVGYYLFQGWETGVVSLIASLVSFFLAIWIATRYHFIIGNFFTEKFGIPASWTSAISSIIVFFIAEAILSELFHFLLRKLPNKIFQSKANRVLGLSLSALNGLLIISFFLLLISVLPIRGTVKQDIGRSTIGSSLLRLTDRYAGNFKSSLGAVAKQATKFLTIHPDSKETVPLDIDIRQIQLTVDTAGEQQMVNLINVERKKVGFPALQFDETIASVARLHSREMFERKYFSHIAQDGSDTATRMERGGVSFAYAGENLAYAPDVATAHEGLMNSPGHRRNILDPEFHRIGIGIIDSGTYGRIFTQNFAD